MRLQIGFNERAKHKKLIHLDRTRLDDDISIYIRNDQVRVARTKLQCEPQCGAHCGPLLRVRKIWMGPTSL